MTWQTFIEEQIKAYREETEGNWSWVRFFADRAWRHAGTHGGEVGTERTVQLLLAVGNFKRQTPIRLGHFTTPMDGPIACNDVEEDPSREGITLEVDGTRVELHRDDVPGNCRQLEELRGLATATATTVLAALWPNHHWIMDSRSAPVLAGLLHLEEILQDHRPPDDESAKVNASSYSDWYRPGILELSKRWRVTGQDLERCCFLMPRPESDKDRPWRDFASQAVSLARDSVNVS